MEPRHNTCENEERYENQAMCAGKEYGCLVPYPDNCTQYLVCDCLYPTVMRCPANLWFDNTTKNCNFPQGMECIFYTFDNAESSTQIVTEGTTVGLSTTTEKITTTPTTTTAPKTTTPKTTTPRTTTTPITNTPTTTTPRSTTPTITTITTPKWETTTTIGGSGSSTSSWDPSPPPPGISDDFCRGLAKDQPVYRYPYDCNAYINCTTGYPVLNYCEDDKYFNEFLSICDTPDSVGDCEELPLPTSTTPISTTTPAISTTTEDDGVCGPSPEFIADDYCQSLGNGFYKYDYDCQGYLTCKNGCTYLDYCIADKLFNTWLHICDTPSAVDCTPLPYPTTSTSGQTTESTSSLGTATTESTSISTTEMASTSTTTSTPVTLPPDVNPDACKDLNDDQLIPYAGNCSQFLYCENHEVKLGECPNSMLFNPDFMCCDEPDDVYCYGDRTTTTPKTTTPTTTTPSTTTTIATTPTPTPTTTTTTTKATTLGPDELCANAELSTFFPYPEDCTKYYICLGEGRWYLAKCISGYYDPKTGECGPDVSPTACKEQDTTTSPATTVTTTTEAATRTSTTSGSTPTPTTTTELATTTTSAPSSGGVCSDHDLDDMVAYPNNCKKYIVCRSPIPIAFYCPDDSYYSSELQQCTSWEDSDCDKGESTTTLTPGYTPAPTMCTNSTRDTFPYPENCQWFIRCVDDYIYMMDVCNCGEYYDPITEKCGPDVPSDACRWDYTSTTTNTPASTTTPEESTTAVTRPPPQKGPCDDAEDGQLVPYPNDCTKYIKCDRPIAVSGECDEGDEFSVEFGKCVDAEIAGCSVTTTRKPSTTAGPITTDGTTTPRTTESTTRITTESTTKITTQSSTESTLEPSTESTTVKTTEKTTESSTDGTSTSSPSPTTDSPTTTTEEPSGGGICYGKPEYSWVPYPNNCSKYIECQSPIPIGFDCPEGLEFSPTEFKCMDPELANCSPKATTSDSTTGTTESSSTQKPTSTTENSTTESTTPEPSSTTQSSTTESTTESTTPEPSTTTESSTTKSSTPESTTESTTPEPSSTTVSTTPEPSSTTESSTHEPSSTPDSSTTKISTTESTTESTTSEPSSTTTSTTESTTSKPSSTTESSTTESTTPEPTSTTLHPNTPNICCGYPLGTFLPYPNDCSRYVICDYPIPYAVYCIEGTYYNKQLQQCTETANENC
ncbi:uncharacterized protein Dwil_GK16871 [Drosophila willistoni]|uniref:Chitin-binding type-2 domain-containing protein n=1 Tax=Drosophila willistoni TaxID=7260 RepID=B4MM05_DROWI|nr:mucin-2 [Drosophila willistoni]EDW73014.2 uncharacterized protein Dwil_GK16871 [Drosophila willistoni]